MTAPHHLYTPDEYLNFEQGVEHRNEYVEGQVYAMAGAGLQHNRIVVSLAGQIATRLRGGPCEAFVESMRVRVGQRSAYLYPDVVGVCGEGHIERKRGMETLLNPSLVIEVLSPSTESYDRGRKFGLYCRIASLREYVLIAQDRVHAERYTRPAAPSAEWLSVESDGPDAVLELASVGVTLRLADLYERVEFPVRPPGPRRVREPDSDPEHAYAAGPPGA